MSTACAWIWLAVKVSFAAVARRLGANQLLWTGFDDLELAPWAARPIAVRRARRSPLYPSLSPDGRAARPCLYDVPGALPPIRLPPAPLTRKPAHEPTVRSPARQRPSVFHRDPGSVVRASSGGWMWPVMMASFAAVARRLPSGPRRPFFGVAIPAPVV